MCLEHSNYAYSLFNHEMSKDLVFCDDAPNGNLFVCGELQVKDKTETPGYSHFRIKLFDLDLKITESDSDDDD